MNNVTLQGWLFAVYVSTTANTAAATFWWPIK
jgi:hypothetical protein